MDRKTFDALNRIVRFTNAHSDFKDTEMARATGRVYEWMEKIKNQIEE